MVCSGFEPSGLRIEGADKFLLLDDQIRGRQNEIQKFGQLAFATSQRRAKCSAQLMLFFFSSSSNDVARRQQRQQ